MTEKRPYRKVTGNAVAGGSMAAVLVFIWDIFVPNHPMPAEVAAAGAPALGAIIAWAVSWAPKPE